MGTKHTENRQSKSAHQHSCNAYVAVVPVGSKNRTRPSFDAADSSATEVHIFGGNSWGSRPMFWRIAELRQCTRVRPTQGGRSEWQSLSRSCSWRHPSVELADPTTTEQCGVFTMHPRSSAIRCSPLSGNRVDATNSVCCVQPRWKYCSRIEFMRASH